MEKPALIDQMRSLKLILGIGCLVLALIPALLVLGELTFFFNLPFALCALGLAGMGLFLIAKRKKPLSNKGRVLTVLTIFTLAGFVAIVVVPSFVSGMLIRNANPCLNNLRQIDAAKNQWALENGKHDGDAVTENDIKPFIKLDASGNL